MFGSAPNLDVALCIVGEMISSYIREADRRTISYFHVPLADLELQANLHAL